MNNYFYNQIRRANCALPKKVYGFIVGMLCPRRLERAWRKHATEMQNELNDNNWKRYKFYVSHRDHMVNRDWLRVINYGYFVYDQQA